MDQTVEIPSLVHAKEFCSALKDVFGINCSDLYQNLVQEALLRIPQNTRHRETTSAVEPERTTVTRLDEVLHTVHLLFNEGCKSSSDQRLANELIRLTRLLSVHSIGNQSRTHALLALMLLNQATQMNEEIHLLHLNDLDRTQWDQQLIAQGLFHFAQSSSGGEITRFHLQAGIAACHAKATNYASTDWQQVLSLFDHLIELDQSPITLLNRAIVIANIDGPEAGQAAVAAIKNLEKLNDHFLLYAVLGEFEVQLEDPLAAAGYFRKSLLLTQSESERKLLSQRFAACEALLPG